ncbi:Peptidase M20 domain-containing protein 2, partial [Stegodyphus mimosarum]
MADQDFSIVSSKIDEEKEFFNSVSQDIWKMPELMFKEFHAHAVLTSALEKNGFEVQKHYFMPTAFRADFSSKLDGGPSVAILLEYDALPEVGHACSHNLIAEAGLAASIAIKAAMEADPQLVGKLIVLGTPAEEGGGGKIRLIELGAFEGIDIALMVHPTKVDVADPPTLCIVKV